MLKHLALSIAGLGLGLLPLDIAVQASPAGEAAASAPAAVPVPATVSASMAGQARTPAPASRTAEPEPEPATDAPAYDGAKLRLPAGYRQWIYLTTGFDMSYSANSKPGHHMFDNVFVNPSAYREFMRSGTWPDKTILVIETRGAREKGSINQSGHYQDGDVMGHEVHVRDDARFPGRWTFYSFSDDGQPATMIPRDVDCYSCHEKHAAVDTTFVQFYPTLMPVAQAKATLAPSYLAETMAR